MTAHASATDHLGLLLALLALVVLAGCTAVFGPKVTARETRFEATHPPLGGFVEVDGARVHYVMQGSGPDLVMIHGASGNLRDFTLDLAGRLSGEFRVIAFDRPGLGWSDDIGARGSSPAVQADVLRAAAHDLGVRRPVVLGHSYGGAVALAWALRAPSDPAALVILAGASHPWEGGLGAWTALAASEFGAATVVPLVTAFAPLTLADRAAARIFAPQPVPEGYLAHIGAGLSLRRVALTRNARQLQALRPWLVEMSQHYPLIRQPVEIVHGTADATVPLAQHGARLAEDLPDARLTRLDGVGHMPHHAAPDDVVATIRRAARRAGLRD